jgi:hypothetical protein
MKNLISNSRQSANSRVKSYWRAVPLALRVLAACVLMQACKADEPPIRGQLMVVLQTDMSLPKDVTQVKIQIKRDGKLYHDKNYVVAPGDNWIAKLPGTLAVVASVDQPTPRVEVVVIGLRQSEARVFAKSVTTIPERRTATLFVPIQWLCEGEVRKLPGDAGYESTCSPSDGEERACRAGSCELVEVEESSLKDFEEEDVFGGAEEGSDLGRCFNTQACFESGFSVAPDDACVVELNVPSGYGLNFGLLNPDNGDGILFEKGPREGDRLIPLDKSRLFGWDYAKGTKSTSKPVRVQLPKGVCNRLNDSEFESVVASYNCEAKTSAYPACGPWTDLEVVVDVDEVAPQPSMPTSGDLDAGPDQIVEAGPQIESLTIELPDESVIEIGIPVTLQLLATPLEGGGPTDVADIAEWSSEDEMVATVEGGVVTGHRAGKTVVTAQFGGLTATFEVDVQRGMPQELELSGTPEEPIPAGRTTTLVATATYAGDVEEDVSELIEWSSDDETVATVEGGIVKGLKPGFVTITAVFDGVQTETTLEIGEPVFAGTFSYGQQNVGTNMFQILVRANMSDGTMIDVTADVTWEQLSGEEFGVLDTDTGIVTVTDAGVVGVRVSYEGKTGDVTVNVVFEGTDAG